MNPDESLAFWNVQINHQPILLTRTEARLLRCLVQHAGEAVSEREIMLETWGHCHITNNSIRRYINRLRAKLEENPRVPTRIMNAYSFGYYVTQEVVDYFLG